MGHSETVKLFLTVSIILCLGTSYRTAAFRLNEDGGYNLVTAVDNSDPIDNNEQLRYIQNIKTSFQALSNQLWRASKRQFYINSVELIIPESWRNPDEEYNVSELGGLNSADFRISPQITYPHAKNPNLCGIPGDYVQLPYSFFLNTIGNEFGPIWKTLLVLFARYRYGVWEEHGFIGDTKFPYVYQNLSSANWEVTGCNNAPLVGKFMHIESKEECFFNWNSPEEEVHACRFVPHPGQNTASSSLMHYHWMESVTDFCDETTHNGLANNKQNLFCDRKSVMQVIQSTPDYAAVTMPRVDIPPVTFKTVIQSEKPVLYILLDRGEVQGRHDLALLIPPALATFLARPAIQDAVVAVGSYPNLDVAGSHLKQEVGWSHIGTNVDKVLEAVGNLRIDGPRQRDFSRAIAEAADVIKQRSHPNGAAILLVKYGADLDNLNTTLPESDVILALNNQKILFFSIELSMGPSVPSHLMPVAMATSGTYYVLNNAGDSASGLNNVFGDLAKKMGNPIYFDDQPTTRMITKMDVSRTPHGIQVPIAQGMEAVDVFFSSHVELTRSNFTVQIDNNAMPTAGTFRRSSDWNYLDQSEANTAFTYKFRFRLNEIEDKTSVTVTLNLNCNNSPQLCQGTMTGRAELDTLAGPTDPMVDIDITVSSTAVDLAKQLPLTIYAKATIDGIPVANLYADALITHGTSSNGVTLFDDGNFPDVLDSDGIFSGYFAPDSDGEYRITVRFFKYPTSLSENSEVLKESSLGRLLPIDQLLPEDSCDFYNNCTLKDVPNGYMHVEELGSAIVFSNTSAFFAKPAKVFITSTKSSSSLEWNWFSPRVPGIQDGIQASNYDIRSCPTMQELLNVFTTCLPVQGREVGTPGSPQSLSIPLPTRTTYYALKSLYNGRESEISNIIGVEIVEQDPTPTPGSTSTSTTDPTATTTTPDPTATTTTPDPTATTTTPDPTATTTTPDPTATTTTPDPTATTTTPDPTAPTTTTTTTTTTDPTTTTSTTSTTTTTQSPPDPTTSGTVSPPPSTPPTATTTTPQSSSTTPNSTDTTTTSTPTPPTVSTSPSTPISSSTTDITTTISPSTTTGTPSASPETSTHSHSPTIKSTCTTAIIVTLGFLVVNKF